MKVALNYTKKATEYLRGLFPIMGEKFPTETAIQIAVLSKIQKSVKFLLPDGGRILDKSGPPIIPEILKLPFDSIVIEYMAKPGLGIAGEVLGAENTVEAKKRIIYAEQNGRSISVFSICGGNIFGEGLDEGWMFQPWYAVIKHADGNETPVVDLPNCSRIEGVGISLYPMGAMAGIAAKRAGKGWEVNAYCDMADEISCVLLLLEALTCSNIETDVIPAIKNKKNNNDAIPFDEYRILVVRTHKDKSLHESGFDRNSPREHLRRGHIRKYKSGVSVWINNVVVNAGIGGKIHKHYSMKTTSARQSKSPDKPATA